MTPTLYQSLASERPRRSLLGRHVGGRARERQAPIVPVGNVELRDQAEVEQHDALRRSHQHVGRLDVAVQLAGGVQIRSPSASCRIDCSSRIMWSGDKAECHRRSARSSFGAAVEAFSSAGSGEGVGAFSCADSRTKLRKSRTGDQLHRDEPLLVFRQQLVEGDEVRVGQV